MKPQEVDYNLLSQLWEKGKKYERQPNSNLY